MTARTEAPVLPITPERAAALLARSAGCLVEAADVIRSLTEFDEDDDPLPSAPIIGTLERLADEIQRALSGV
jgi:hypothetical protein